MHGQLWNGARLAASMGVSQPTVARYRDLLERTWMLRVLRPFWTNTTKRLVKAPRVYVRDSGLLHASLQLQSPDALKGHAILGASFEGFVLEQVLRADLDAQASFWRTGGGAEMDIVLHRGREPIAAFEVKHSAAPKLSRGFHQARADLGDPPAFVVTPIEDRWPLANGVEAIGVGQLHEVLEELR